VADSHATLRWQPVASVEVARERARLLATVRQFFADRDVLEVETPVLSFHGAMDPGIDSIRAGWDGGFSGFLQSSPEYHMKRLLAAGYGPMYQVFRAFRAGEAGRRHNPEFSLLEWYRPGFTMSQLMDEVAALVMAVLGCDEPTICSYRDLFYARTGLDPMRAELPEMQKAAARVSGLAAKDLSFDQSLDVLMSHSVEPSLNNEGPVFLVDYPPSQAALARTEIRKGVEVACRFELYVNGVELCNGYHELLDADEQAGRFAADNQTRQSLGKPEMKVPGALLDALDCGLPDCSGVALGLDRLLMLKLRVDSINDVLTFPLDRA